ncbi:hypothetical protein V6Z11_1Z096200 [Gossypium hirsutum]
MAKDSKSLLMHQKAYYVTPLIPEILCFVIPASSSDYIRFTSHALICPPNSKSTSSLSLPTSNSSCERSHLHPTPPSQVSGPIVSWNNYILNLNPYKIKH